MRITPELITALAAVAVAISTLIGTIFSNNKTLALLGQRLDQIERKVGEHNHLEARSIAQEEQMKTVFNNISELKADLKRLEKRDGP